METFDIILDNSGDLQADVNGDFVQGDNANNLLRYLIEATKGQYKEFPLVGVGIELFLNSNKNPQQIQREIRLQLISDVFQNPDIDVTGWPNVIRVNKVVFNVTN